MTSRRPGSGRPTASKRSSLDQSSSSSMSDIAYECKASYLVVFDDIRDDIRNRRQLAELLQQSGRNPTRKVLTKYWTEDTDSLSFEEFITICKELPKTSEDDLIQAFRKIDLNGDGYIDNGELRRVLTTRGERMSEAEVQEIIDEVDENDDGRLDYKEFSQMLLNTQDECTKLALRNLDKRLKKPGKVSSYTTKGKAKEEEDSDDNLEVQSQKNGKTRAHDDDDDSDEGIIISTKKPPSASQKEKFGSSTSLTSNRSEVNQNRKGSLAESRSSKLSTTKRRDSAGSHHSTMSANVRPSPRMKERPKSPLAGKELRLPKPKRLKDWNLTHSKGCFFFDDGNKIVSHQYQMRLRKDTSVWLTVEPFSIRPGGDLNSAREVSRSPIDTMLFVLRGDGSLVTFTEQRDARGKYGVRCDLEKGVYRVVPFTTGCRFKPRTSEPSSETKLVKRTDNKFVLSKAFKEALNDIFDMCDLDGNGSLSRDEFSFFNIRTSGEGVNDTEWEVVEDKLELKSGEITRQGFLQLNQMEADDNEGDTEELWVTLESMGFNKNLNMDEACPFFLEVYAESCNPDLKVTGINADEETLDQALVDATIGKGESIKIKNMKDLYLHTYMNDFRACLVVENKSHHGVRVRLDSSKSENCSTHTNNPSHTLDVPSRTCKIGQHVMPTKETREWLLRCQESVLK